MYVIEIQEYDYFTGTTIEQKKFDTVDEANEAYRAEQRRDFDYGDHYRKTKKMW